MDLKRNYTVFFSGTYLMGFGWTIIGWAGLADVDEVMTGDRNAEAGSEFISSQRPILAPSSLVTQPQSFFLLLKHDTFQEIIL